MRQFTMPARPARKQNKGDFKAELNEQQYAAVSCGEGPKLIIAGAGSGKTRTITYRVAYLMMHGMPPSSILLATFTNKAAREMLNRVELLTSQESASLWGGTFHSLANRFLRHHAPLVGFEKNYSILDDQDQKDFFKLCVREANIKTYKERFPSPGVLRAMTSLSFNTGNSLGEIIDENYSHFDKWRDEIIAVAALYEKRKRAANAFDYDDLLKYWRQLFRDHPDVLEYYGNMFKAILVDEYQDTNAVQADIVEMLAHRNGNNLMVVGDDCQSIYAFRGANFENILQFPERNPGTEIFKLEINYRSTPEILHFTNASICRNERQFQKTLTAVKASGFFPTVVPLNDIYQEASFICERIMQLRDDGIALDDMAVLYRAHSHSMLLQTELAKRNIAYEVRSGVRFFEQAHIKDVIAYLKVLENPQDEIAWRRLFLMIPKIGNVTANRIWEHCTVTSNPFTTITEDSRLLSRVPAAAVHFWRRFAEDLRTLAEGAHQQEPAWVIEQVLETSYKDFLCSRYENATSRMDDIEQLALFSKQYDSLHELVGQLVLLGELYGNDVAGAKESDERLILSSIHQSKGLEWQVVFVLRLHDGAFPSPLAAQEENGEEEERRIFYVATTRAQDELYLTYPLFESGNNYYGGGVLRPSRFIHEIDDLLYEHAEVTEIDAQADTFDAFDF